MKKTLLTLTACAALASNLNAAIVFSESFPYPNGPIVGAPSSPWLNNSGTANSMVVTNNQLEISTSRSEDIITALPGGPISSNGPVSAVYTSFKVNFIQTPTLGGAYFTHLVGEAAGSFRGRVWSTTTNSTTSTLAPAGSFFIGIANFNIATPANAQLGVLPNVLTTNVTYTIVTRYDLDTGTNTIWINPSAESDPSATATDDPVSLVNVASYGCRQATGEGTLRMDDLKVGTSFNDVAGANTSPTISSISDQNTAQNTATPAIPFIVNDAETAPGSLGLTGSSSDQTLIPNANIVFGGSGMNRTVTITPATGQQGAATITIQVSDGLNNSSVDFLLRVGAPTISAIANQSAPTNTVIGPIAFTVGDAESGPAGLTLQATSSNPSLIPNGNVTFGGSGANRTVSVTPLPGQSGLSTITIGVSDGANTNTTTFRVTIFPLLGLLFSDNFVYLDGPLLNAPGSPWGNHSGAFFEISVLGEQAVLSGGLTEDLNAGITNAIGTSFGTTNGYVLYSGFTVNFSALPSAVGDYFAHFRDNGSGFRARVFASTTNAASGKFRLGIANQGGVASVEHPVDLSLGTTYSVVTRYNVGTGVSTLWVNPSSEASPNYDGTDTLGITSIATYALRQSGGIGTNTVDNLKIGTSFLDVATLVAPAPSLTIALVGSDVKISWPVSATGYVLKSRADVASGTWTTVGQTPTVVGDQNVVTISSPAGTQFYQLEQ